MLNVDGNRYDREEFCGENAWETCPTGGWRKNLRNNGPQPLPDFNEQVDEDCDGVDLNRNFQFEWGWPLGATVPLVPGTCTPAEDERAGITNNDVYTDHTIPPTTMETDWSTKTTLMAKTTTMMVAWTRTGLVETVSLKPSSSKI